MASAEVALQEDPSQLMKEKVEEEETKEAIDFSIKHPLQNRWCLWFFKNDKSKDWADNLRQITSFDTVEDFWGTYNYVQTASKLQTGCDYNLFKDGIKPMWEDPKNRNGGRWLINFDKKMKGSDMDKFWLETVLCLIGENFEDDSDAVNGAVINIRAKGTKISLWLGESKREDVVIRIGRKLKDTLGLPPRYSISFEAHQDTINKKGSSAKARFTI